MAIDIEYMESESALKRVGNNVNLYKRLLNVYLADNYIEELCAAIESGNNAGTAELAHTIKGVCANLSLNKLKNLSADIDQKAKAGQDCKDMIPELRAVFEKTVENINEYLNS